MSGPFNLRGDVRKDDLPYLNLKDFQIDGTGAADVATTFEAVIAAANALGGCHVVSPPGQTYLLSSTVYMTAPNTHWDMNGSTVIGSGQMFFSRQNLAATGYDNVLRNVSYSNAFSGDGVGSLSKLPLFLYCEDALMKNCHRHSYGDTGVNMFMCRRTRFVDITSRGGKDSGGGAFAALMLYSEDCTFENIVGLDGPFTYGMQIKGGRNNKRIRCKLQDLAHGSVVSNLYGFYDRGDVPWGSAPVLGYAYPWSGGLTYTDADERRASRNTLTIDCDVVDSDFSFAAYHAQECIGSRFLNCTAESITGAGLTAASTTGGNEHDLLIHNFRAKTITGIGVSINGTLTTGVFPNIRIIDPLIKNADSVGIYLLYADGAVVGGDSALIHNCATAQSGELRDGVHVINSRNCRVRARIIDDRGTTLHRYGVRVSSTSPDCDLTGTYISGLTSTPVNMSNPGKTDLMTPGAISFTSTDGTSNTAQFPTAPVSGTSIFLEAIVQGVDSAGVMGRWHIGAVFQNSAGTVTQVGSTTTLSTAINPGAWSGVSFSVVSNTARVVIQGKAATTIKWIGSVNSRTV